ncbi:MAG: HAD-IB family phosphatase [Gemmatimonadaceae bacterium]|nr:HAD-IB family phosphatase [Gemmatimonadaceae bacterium]
MRRYASVVLDADSTLAAIEGIDWLAARRGAEVQRAVVSLTDRAMNGELPLEAVYGERLRVIAPTAADIAALADAYRTSLAPGVADAIAALHAAGIVVHVVSGGLRPALLPMTRDLGIADTNVHAVEPTADAHGRFEAVRPTALTTQLGKRDVVRALALPRPVLAVGDGATDLAMAPAVDAFAAYIGFVRRDAVVAGAALTLDSFAALVAHALSA